MTLPIDLLRALPKTDLHVHLDGSMRLSTLIERYSCDPVKFAQVIDASFPKVMVDVVKRRVEVPQEGDSYESFLDIVREVLESQGGEVDIGRGERVDVAVVLLCFQVDNNLCRRHRLRRVCLIQAFFQSI